MRCYRGMLAMAALFLTSLGAQAEAYDLKFDVNATTRIIGSTQDGVYGEIADQQFQPQRFSYMVHFDLGAATQVPGFSEVDGMKLFSAVYDSGPSSTSPFTEQVRGALSGNLGEPSLDYNNAYYVLSTPATDGAPSHFPAATQMSLSTGSVWFSGGTAAWYMRMISMSEPGEPAQWVEWTSADFLAFMQARVGKLQHGAFLEEGVSSSTSGSGFGATPTVIANNVRIYGDATLVSITAVPEPATFALMGLGLVGVTAVASRKRHA